VEVVPMVPMFAPVLLAADFQQQPQLKHLE
jgi:hypothetical protein